MWYLRYLIIIPIGIGLFCLIYLPAIAFSYFHIARNYNCIQRGDVTADYEPCLWLVSQREAQIDDLINFMGEEEYAILRAKTAELIEYRAWWGYASFHVSFDDKDRVLAAIPTYE